MAHLYNCVYSQNRSPPRKASDTHGLLQFLSSAFRTLCKEWRRDQYLSSQLHWSCCYNILHSRMSVCFTDYCCMPREKGIQTLLTQTWRAAKGLLGMATECLLSRDTQLFLHSEVPLLLFLSTSLLPPAIVQYYASSINIPILTSCGWLTSQLHLCKSHNTQLQFDPCYNSHKRQPSVPCALFMLCSSTLIFQSECSLTPNPPLPSLDINHRPDLPSALSLSLLPHIPPALQVGDQLSLLKVCHTSRRIRHFAHKTHPLMATPSNCTPCAAAQQLPAHLSRTTTFLSPSMWFHTSNLLHVWQTPHLSCLPQPLQEAANETPLSTPHTSSPTTLSANSVTSVSSHHSSLFTVFHLTFSPSHALVTPANPTHSEPPTWAALPFCCTLYHSYRIINFKCKACLAFGFLFFQIFLET